MKATLIVVCLAITLQLDAIIGADYCQKNLCRGNNTHVGCGTNDSFANFGPNCPTERANVAMKADLKAYLLKKHNQARSNIANGKVTGYATANRMIEMVSTIWF